MSTARAKTIVVNSFDAELSVTYYKNKDKPKTKDSAKTRSP